MKGITFHDLREAKEYQSKKRQEGYLTQRTRTDGGYVVVITGEAPEWENAQEVENVSDAIKDEKGTSSENTSR